MQYTRKGNGKQVGGERGEEEDEEGEPKQLCVRVLLCFCPNGSVTYCPICAVRVLSMLDIAVVLVDLSC